MIQIEKAHIGLAPYDTEVVEQDIKDEGIELSNDFILCYDTADSVVYHTKAEIKTALDNIREEIIEIFNETYEENEDIHDCIEADIVDTITVEVMNGLSLNAEKFFLTLQDEIEDILVTRFMEAH